MKNCSWCVRSDTATVKIKSCQNSFDEVNRNRGVDGDDCHWLWGSEGVKDRIRVNVMK